MLRAAVLAVLAVLATATGCSEDGGCSGRTYAVDRSVEGAASPVRAVETWLGAGGDFDDPPPAEGWTVLQTDEADPAEVVLTNDAGEGWWVQAVRTEQGGYVVAQATDRWRSCEHELG